MKNLNKTFIIAEIGQAHDGSLGIAHSYIDALANTGVNAIKFQTHIAEAESSIFENFRVNFSYEDKTRFDYWKRMEFEFDQWLGLKNHCEKLGLEFISSPFSCLAVDLLEKIGVDKYKVGSGEVRNKLLIDKICKTGKEILISSGMSTIMELEQSISWINNFNQKYSLFQCTTEYPTSPEDWGLGVIQDLKEKFQVPVGFSDHSGDIYSSLAAVALGADMLEFHVVFSKEMFGPDSKASLTIEQVKTLVKGVRQLEISNSSLIRKDCDNRFLELKQLFGKSLCVNKKLKAGYVLTFDDLEAKKPMGRGIDAAEYTNIIGKKLKHDLEKWDFINYQDL